MATEKPPLRLELGWQGDLVFAGTSGQASMTLDSAGVAGPSPMQALAFALAGCMGMDLVHILQKGRHSFTALTASLSGTRAPEDPRRFTEIELHFTIAGEVPAAVVQRGIDLSRDKYCSVWSSLREDTKLTVTFETQNSELRTSSE